MHTSETKINSNELTSSDLEKGLTQEQVHSARSKFGYNKIEQRNQWGWWKQFLRMALEPIFLLLLVGCGIYLLLGEWNEAILMFVSILFVAGIEVVQEGRSRKALEALKTYTQGKYKVLRDGNWTEVISEELVPGDVVQVEEGDRIPADGQLIQGNDLSIDESPLTGESLPVVKQILPNETTLLYQGTTVSSGQGVVRLTATGGATELGKLGLSIETIDSSPTPLQIQIKHFVKQMGIAGAIAFVFVIVLNLSQGNTIWNSLLFSLTLAMAILPEEIPVAFSAFMAIGAYRMTKLGILAKEPRLVESLGSATVICLDKTGTLTENRMSVAEVKAYSDTDPLALAGWASEVTPFDAMEKAILKELENKHQHDIRRDHQMIHEYPLGGNPPMMTHVWQDGAGNRVVACKGAIERILSVAGCSDSMQKDVLAETERMAGHGFRVLGVASAEWNGDLFPDRQDDFNWSFSGLVAFYDPPKPNAREVLNMFSEAGIRVMMLTGDHPATALNIAKSVGIVQTETPKILTGQEITTLSDEQLDEAIRQSDIFARMFPDAKLRVINTLKRNGETVAMTGDGVNDGPALKSAHIGVAMGLKGTEIARSAANLVLLTDDLSGMVKAIAMGRRIYDNLLKAIRYVISIHIPIVLTVLLPLLLRWPYTHILLPLHVIFLELVMDPTAAIVFENEPAETGAMKQPPRRKRVSLFTGKELFLSVIQGFMITLGVLVVYQILARIGSDETTVRSGVFMTLALSNVLLTLVNRSFQLSMWKCMKFKNTSLRWIIGLSILLLFGLIYFPPVASLFKMAPLALFELGICAGTAMISVLWFEVAKWVLGKS